MTANLWNALIGGLILASCVLSFSAFYGRVLGISGIVNNALFKRQTWQMSFLIGMLVVGCFQPAIELNLDSRLIMASGFLVGFGVTMGNGCTSGHGLCGIARLSKRSIVAVFTFMMVAMVTRLVINDVNGLNHVIQYQDSIQISQNNQILLLIAVIGAIIGFYNNFHMAFVCFFVGMMFAIGLSIGGMIYPSKVVGFLNLSMALRNSKFWTAIDPSLGVVFASGLLPNLLLHRYITTVFKNPLSGCKWNFPHKNIIDFRLITGAALFGIGWGICGLCPGPAVTFFPQYVIYGNLSILIWWAGMLAGMYSAMKIC